MQVRLLGTPAIRWRGRQLTVDARKPAGIVYALALRREGISRAELAEVFWDVRGRSNLRSALYRLRRDAHADAWLLEDSRTEVLRLEGGTDLDAFEQRIAEGDHAGALEIWHERAGASGVAATLLRGFALPEAPAFEDLLSAQRERLLGLFRSCVMEHTGLLSKQGALEEALRWLDVLVAEDPLDEEVHRRIMTVAWRLGDPQRALRQYETCRRALADELGLPPVAATRELYRAIRSDANALQRLGTGRTGSHDPGELPLVGRANERAGLRGALDAHRWVTLVGPGGIGKTRLARVAADDQRHSGRPVVFVPLDAVGSPDVALAAAANAARVAFEGAEPPVAQLARGIRGTDTVLVLDNAEHLLPELGRAIEELLDLVPDVTVLVTSRIAARCEAEHVVSVAGLEAPSGPEDPEGSDRDAVRLFVAAARRVDPRFRLDDDVFGDVMRVCSVLRGHPLGLRLAAGWLRFRSCAELAAALRDDPLRLENPGVGVSVRHATLRGVMETTWDLLAPDEADRLSLLAVFRGPFDAGAAHAVAGAGPQVLGALTASGWLQPAAPGGFELHPLIRAFGLERLEHRPDADEVHARHARWYLDRLARREPDILSEDPRDALDATEREWDNIHAAWTFAARAGWSEVLVAAAEALSLYADMRVRFPEAERMFEEAVRAQASSQTRAPERDRRRATVVLGCARAAHLDRLARFEDALEEVDRALDASRRVADLDERARHGPLKLRGDVLMGLGRYAEALATFRAALELSRSELPDRVSRDLRALANAEAVLGMHDAAERHYRAAVARDRERGYAVGLAIDLNNLAELLIDLGRLDEAEACIRESRGIADGVDLHLVPYLELSLAALHEKRGEVASARAHAETGAALAGRFGQSVLRSRAATRLASLALAAGRVAAAEGHLVEALEVASRVRDASALVHALVARARLARARGDEGLALRCLGAVLAHPGAEARDVREAERLLGDAQAPEPAPSVEAVLAELGWRS